MRDVPWKYHDLTAWTAYLDEALEMAILDAQEEGEDFSGVTIDEFTEAFSPDDWLKLTRGFGAILEAVAEVPWDGSDAKRFGILAYHTQVGSGIGFWDDSEPFSEDIREAACTACEHHPLEAIILSYGEETGVLYADLY